MEKLFVNHKLSLLAKEKGFDETCIAYFDIEDGNKLKMIPQGEEINSFHSNRNKLMIAAPIREQLIDWLLDKYGIHIIVDFGIGWGYQLIHHGTSDLNFEEEFIDNINCNTKYEALDKAIESALKLI